MIDSVYKMDPIHLSGQPPLKESLALARSCGMPSSYTFSHVWHHLCLSQHHDTETPLLVLVASPKSRQRYVQPPMIWQSVTSGRSIGRSTCHSAHTKNKELTTWESLPSAMLGFSKKDLSQPNILMIGFVVISLRAPHKHLSNGWRKFAGLACMVVCQRFALTCVDCRALVDLQSGVAQCVFGKTMSPKSSRS